MNLANLDLSEAELADLLSKNKGEPVPPRMEAPEWRKAAANPTVKKWMEEIRKLAEEESSQPLPELTDELYGNFSKTGERYTFESRYFERHRIFARVALMVLLGEPREAERFAPDLVEKIREMMAEESWAFPAHVGAASGKDPFAIDLFGAETANLMAETLHIFGKLIPAGLASDIRARLQTQFFENYLENHKKFAWFQAGMNWNAVCHQGVLGAALTICDDPALLARLLLTASKGLPRFLDGFGEDGSTSEGPGYWQYGFGWFSELNEQLEARTKGKLSLFEGNAKIERIAHFGPNLVFRNAHLVNFSDNGRNGILRASMLAYLGERLDSGLLRANARVSYSYMAENGIPLHHQRSDFFFLSRLTLRCPDAADTAPAVEAHDVFFADYGALVARGEDKHGRFWEFAAKAGNNYEHHNHNDCGSYILHLNGAPAVIEIGAPEYVADFFGEKRYTFLAARSSGHSVPLVNGCEQPPGAEYQAEVLEYALGGNEVKFAIDLTKCYPAEAWCKRLVRTFTLDKREGSLTVSDRCEFDGTGTLESLILCEAPAGISGGGAWIDAPCGRLRLTGLDGTTFKELDSPEYRTHVGQPGVVHRLHLVPAGNGGTTQITAYKIDAAQ